MTAAVAHRGPDGEGLWRSPSGQACLGHRRLSVIDLAAGAQPMVHPDGDAAISFNGEIYNYLELRGRLLALGQQFRTASDTEVLLQLLRNEGLAGLAGTRGMFALGFWNDRLGTLLLARDRLGKKPLYYELTADGVYFCSSLEPLRRTSHRPPALDVVALAQFLNLGYIPAPRTAFEGFFKLPAATALEFSATAPHGSPHTFWRADALSQARDSETESLDALHERLEESVRLRLRSDVPLGLFLSGGIDSTLIAAMATRALKEPLRTFTVGFDGLPGDESAQAAEVARHLGTHHQTLHARSDLLALLPEAMRHFGEPFGDATALSVWRLAEVTREHVTVVLTGDGGDELFGGYDWYAQNHRLSQVRSTMPQPAWALADVIAGSVADHAPRSVQRASRALHILRERDSARRYAAMRRHFSARDARRLASGDLREAFEDGSAGAELVVQAYEDTAGDELRHMRYADMRTYLADCMMPKTDVATMAHGLEARAPLLDQEVAQHALSIPSARLMEGRNRKIPLRRLLQRLLPQTLWDRPKQGFNVPLGTWFQSPAMERARRDLAVSDALHQAGWFREGAVASLIDEHMREERDHGDRLFHLLALDAWLRQL